MAITTAAAARNQYFEVTFSNMRPMGAETNSGRRAEEKVTLRVRANTEAEALTLLDYPDDVYRITSVRPLSPEEIVREEDRRRIDAAFAREIAWNSSNEERLRKERLAANEKVKKGYGLK